jgi:tRNA(His) guanylyltransferase
MRTGKDSLGTRMKLFYEHRDRHFLMRRAPVLMRIDGRAFHTYCRDAARPFDMDIVSVMQDSAAFLVSEIQGCKAAYVQSDEVSLLLTDYDELHTDAWFDYNKSKIETIAASMMSVTFCRKMWDRCSERLARPDSTEEQKTIAFQRSVRPAYFDARAWNMPKEEVANYFLWRAKGLGAELVDDVLLVLL